MIEQDLILKEHRAKREGSLIMNIWYSILDIHEKEPFTESTFNEMYERLNALKLQQGAIIQECVKLKQTNQTK